MVCSKGGSSKTTTTTALAVEMARRGLKVLVVDCDGQANASWTLLGGHGAEAPTLAEVLLRQATADEAIRPTSTVGPDLLPADSSLGAVNVQLATTVGRDVRLRSALATVEDRYDVCLLDTGPALNPVLVNALVATDEVIVPLDGGMYSVLGLVELEATLAEVREAYNPGLKLAGLLLTRIQRTNVARDVEAELRARYGPLVFAATIPQSVAFEAAHTRGLTIMDHAPKSAGALAYQKLVGEIIDGRTKERRGVKARRGPGAVDAA
jgi:chromosome partitioning protein